MPHQWLQPHELPPVPRGSHAVPGFEPGAVLREGVQVSSFPGVPQEASTVLYHLLFSSATRPQC